MQTAFAGPLRIKQRLGTLDPKTLAGTDLELAAAFREKPAVHRFPGSMAARVQELAAYVTEEYGGDAARLWTEAGDGDDLRARICGAAGLRRDEGQDARCSARKAIRRFGGAGDRAGTPHAGRCQIAAGPRRLSGREAGAQGSAAREGCQIEIRTLTDGGQPAEETARALADWIGAAQRTLDIAIYDLRLPDALAKTVVGALTGAADRGVDVRLAYNLDHPDAVPVPPPPETNPELVESLPFPTVAIPGVPDLMHHKYVVRDAESVWTGSTNWTGDSWTREENVIVTVESPELASHYHQNFEELWTLRTCPEDRQGRYRTDRRRESARAGVVLPGPRREARPPHREGDRNSRPRGPDRVAGDQLGADPGHTRRRWPPTAASTSPASSTARRSSRCCGSGRERQRRVEGAASPNRARRAPFSGKNSTPYGPGTVHDYMHAKVTVADDLVFVGSFNLSHSGELNAENVLEIADPALAERLAGFVDEIRGKYPAIAL